MSNPTLESIKPWFSREQAVVLHALACACKGQVRPEDRRHVHLAAVALEAALNGSDQPQCVHRPTDEIR